MSEQASGKTIRALPMLSQAAKKYQGGDRPQPA